MRNPNKRQTNELFAIIFNKTLSLCKKAAYLLKQRCCDIIDS